MRTWSFAKGHGTLNDFVLLMDRNAWLDPSPDDVRFLCDRRRGLGADGLLRAVWSQAMPDWDGTDDVWFMDYRNADGSVAETCGNGLRVFVRWLADQGLVSGSVVPVATRAGLRHGVLLPGGRVAVTMGRPVWSPGPTVIEYAGRAWNGHWVDVGNPHIVVRVASREELTDLDLSQPAQLDPSVAPQGANLEFVWAEMANRLTMRVWERGVGETMSCGTGVVAAALDARQADGGRHDTIQVDVPGGRLKVTFDDAGEATLAGPAVVVAEGEVVLPDD